MQMMQAAAAGQCNQRMIVVEQAQRSESKIKADIGILTLLDVYESIAFRLC